VRKANRHRGDGEGTLVQLEHTNNCWRRGLYADLYRQQYGADAGAQASDDAGAGTTVACSLALIVARARRAAVSLPPTAVRAFGGAPAATGRRLTERGTGRFLVNLVAATPAMDGVDAVAAHRRSWARSPTAQRPNC